MNGDNSQLSTTDSHLLLGTGPDLEGSAIHSLPSSYTPPPLAAKALRDGGSDRGDHHYRLLSRELDRLEARLAALRKRFLASSYA